MSLHSLKLTLASIEAKLPALPIKPVMVSKMLGLDMNCKSIQRVNSIFFYDTRNFITIPTDCWRFRDLCQTALSISMVLPKYSSRFFSCCCFFSGSYWKSGDFDVVFYIRNAHDWYLRKDKNVKSRETHTGINSVWWCGKAFRWICLHVVNLCTGIVSALIACTVCTIV